MIYLPREFSYSSFDTMVEAFAEKYAEALDDRMKEWLSLDRDLTDMSQAVCHMVLKLAHLYRAEMGIHKKCDHQMQMYGTESLPTVFVEHRRCLICGHEEQRIFNVPMHISIKKART